MTEKPSRQSKSLPFHTFFFIFFIHLFCHEKLKKEKRFENHQHIISIELILLIS